MNEEYLTQDRYFAITSDFSKAPGMIRVNENIKDFDSIRFLSGEIISDWPDGITFYCEGDVALDYWKANLLWNIVSDQVRNVFHKHKLKGVQFLPINVMHVRTKENLGPYWVLNVYKMVEKLRRNHVQGLDIFRAKDKKGEGRTEIFISHKLRHYLNKGNALSGFGFRNLTQRILDKE